MTEPYLAIQVVMMPRDTNPHGTIFGGVILSYLDQAGALGARRGDGVARRGDGPSPERRVEAYSMFHDDPGARDVAGE